jgi:hypothetical protein
MYVYIYDSNSCDAFAEDKEGTGWENQCVTAKGDRLVPDSQGKVI